MWVIISSTDDGDYIAEQEVNENTDCLDTTSELSEAMKFKTKSEAEKWVKPFLRCRCYGEEPQIIGPLK